MSAKTYYFGPYDFTVKVNHEKLGGLTHVSCPYHDCTSEESSHFEGLSAEKSVEITANKMRNHLRIIHGVKTSENR